MMSDVTARQRAETGPAPLPMPGADWGFLLDVDGTLIDIAPTPGGVSVDPRLLPILERLHAAAGGAVAFVSGRSLADLDRLFAPLKLIAAGIHGLERRDATGRVIRPARDSAALAAAREALEAFVRGAPGTILEDKGLALALHYREAPGQEEAARAAAEKVVAKIGEGFQIQRGKMVVEVRPVGPDKGRVVETIMAEAPFAGRRPVFVGDDATDEDGFAAVNRMGGVSVRVGDDGPSAAKWRIPTVEALLTWLSEAPDEMSALEGE